MLNSLLSFLKDFVLQLFGIIELALQEVIAWSGHPLVT
jgi:hypothetical protein